jgi:hypothetical protein
MQNSEIKMQAETWKPRTAMVSMVSAASKFGVGEWAVIEHLITDKIKPVQRSGKNFTPLPP